MQVGILINARLGSTRLARKHLLTVAGKPILDCLIQRIRGEFHEEMAQNQVKALIATSDEPENTEFEKFCGPALEVFYGSRQNIPLRHLQAAREHYLEAVVSVDGDDILCSPWGMRQVYEALAAGASYVRTSNLPFGMNSGGYSVKFLENSLENHTEEILETGWGRIFNERMVLDLSLSGTVANDERLRFTLDYSEDYQFFKSVIEFLGNKIYPASDAEIVNLVLEKEFYKLNEVVNKQYWDNFYSTMDQEVKKTNRDS